MYFALLLVRSSVPLSKVVAAAEALSAALASIEQLAAHESTSSLQLLADQRAKLMGLAEVRLDRANQTEIRDTIVRRS